MKTINIQKILVPIDFSELSTYAVEYAMQIAHIHASKIILVHAIEDMLNFSVPGDFVLTTEEFIEKEKELHKVKSERIEKYALNMREKYSYAFESRVVFGKSHRAITELVEQEKIDLVVMSTHGVSGFREFVIGSNAVRIISECPCPVLSVQKAMPSPTINKILLPFKDDPFSRQKVNIAIQFAKWFDAEVYTLGIETEGEESHYLKIQREGKQIKDYLDSFGVKNSLKIVESNNVSKAILNYGKEIEASMLLVMADMEREDFVEYLMGPVAQQLVNHSSIPVLSVQPTRHPDTIDLHPYGW